MNLPVNLSPALVGVLLAFAIIFALVFFKVIKWGLKIIISLAVILLIVGFFLYLLT